MVNFDLHRRKVFWVDAALSFMLENTDLDVAGREHPQLGSGECPDLE